MIEAIVLSALLQAGAEQLSAATQPDPLPYDGEWIVEVIDQIKVMPGSRVTLNVHGGYVSGLASCNTYRGAFTVSGEQVKVGELLKTMKACDGPTMSQEADFLAVLAAVVRYEIKSKDTLVLTTGSGKSITAKRALRS